MMTQIDEVASDRHIRMSILEFIEALARIAEKISPSPIGENFEKWDIMDR
jgi:hypothetical protein